MASKAKIKAALRKLLKRLAYHPGVTPRKYHIEFTAQSLSDWERGAGESVVDYIQPWSSLDSYLKGDTVLDFYIYEKSADEWGDRELLENVTLYLYEGLDEIADLTRENWDDYEVR